MKLIFLFIILTPASPRAINVGAFPTAQFCEAAKPGFRELYADFHNIKLICGRPLAPLVSPRPRIRK
ncbi:MAG: hypothetical protein PF443_09315 [Allgaiera sp.]|nr:hypothetical protein [Allgaiera sp.]